MHGRLAVTNLENKHRMVAPFSFSHKTKTKMKKQLRKQRFKSLLLAVLAFIPLTVSAQIEINEENFPDENFRNYLSNKPYGWDGIITEDEIKEITQFLFIGVDEIKVSSLKGIEYFTALQKLYCCKTNLTSLDVSRNTALEELYCYDNELNSLNISGCVALKELNCQNNKLVSLDISACMALISLNCRNNELTSLDISGHSSLTSVNCFDNNMLTSLNASGCTAFELAAPYWGNLMWGDAPLTTLDMSNCTSLTSLSCDNGELTCLNVLGCTALESLFCSNNHLTSLDVSNCTALKNLACRDNPLMALNVSGCTALTSLTCRDYQLASLDVSGCITLESLYCSNNQLQSLNVSDCTALTLLECYLNTIKEDAMDVFISSLPENTTGENRSLRIVDIYSDKEGNVCTTDHVAKATAKGWSVENMLGWKYEGSIPTNVVLPIMKNINGDSPIYDLSGKRVNNLQGKKGVYIVGGKKVLVK